jgi:hypothetical protein
MRERSKPVSDEKSAPGGTAAKAIAFANGLRTNVTVAGRRWAQWPGGTNDLAEIVACIERIRLRLQSLPATGTDEAVVAACVADLRAVLEWTAYQSASIATARAILVARRTRAFAERFGLLDDRVSGLSTLLDSEESLLDNVRTKNGYMIALAERYPQLGLPPPLVDPERLTRKTVTQATGRLALIQRLKESAKRTRP